EPLGGAHRNPDLTLQNLSQAIDGALRQQAGLDGGVLRAKRRDKFLEMGRAGLA
ncbi:MAG TPA: acetyl-CoA carboxylase carboxyl transferase subunit alpha, partial [Magnetospirillum sp.]|nr:acetyl-CoA carboxylase carboxyl transferase subunit alpha [Magnetospirillum sp.]